MRPMKFAFAMCVACVSVGRFAGSALLTSAEAGTSSDKKIQHGIGCSPSDAQYFPEACAPKAKPVSSLGPSVSCEEAPRGFSSFRRPPQPFGPIVLLCG